MRGGRRRKRQRHVAALLGLRAHQLPVGAAKLHQVAMRAAFDDAAVIEHQDAVGIDDAGEPVRQDQGRAPGHQAVERALDDGFVLGIDRGQRLVENEDRRVAQQRPRDRKPLALSTRKPQAALADDEWRSPAAARR